MNLTPLQQIQQPAATLHRNGQGRNGPARRGAPLMPEHWLFAGSFSALPGDTAALTHTSVAKTGTEMTVRLAALGMLERAHSEQVAGFISPN